MVAAAVDGGDDGDGAAALAVAAAAVAVGSLPAAAAAPAVWMPAPHRAAGGCPPGRRCRSTARVAAAAVVAAAAGQVRNQDRSGRSGVRPGTAGAGTDPSSDLHHRHRHCRCTSLQPSRHPLRTSDYHSH